jgi:hypothetical protein
MTVPSTTGSVFMRRVVFVVGLACLLASALAGCALDPPEMQTLHVKVTVGPKAHEAAIRITATGDPIAGEYAGVYLAYPDGHRRVLNAGDRWGPGDVGYCELDGLPSGVYRLTAYAVPGKLTDAISQNGMETYRPFPVSEMIKMNLVVSRTFVIP